MACKKIDNFFHPITPITEHQEKILEYIKEVLRENKSVHSAFGTLGTSDS